MVKSLNQSFLFFLTKIQTTHFAVFPLPGHGEKIHNREGIPTSWPGFQLPCQPGSPDGARERRRGDGGPSPVRRSRKPVKTAPGISWSMPVSCQGPGSSSKMRKNRRGLRKTTGGRAALPAERQKKPCEQPRAPASLPGSNCVPSN